MELEEKRKLIPEIDYSKTIAKHRIVYKKTAWSKFFDVIGYVCSIIFIIIFILVAYQGLLNNNYGLFFGLACPAWIIISYAYMNKLIKMSGFNSISNKEDVIEALKSV